MGVARRVLNARADLRALLDFSHAVWRTDPELLNFEMSFGTVAWEGGGFGRARSFHRDEVLRGWCRLVPGYSRIRAAGRRDQAPPSLVWQTDPGDDQRRLVLESILDWASTRAETAFTTAYNPGDSIAREVLTSRGFVPDASEPYSGYLQQGLGDLPPETECIGYRFVTMSELDDAEQRAEVHRLAWEGSTRSSADVRETMATWPYKPELDLIAVSDDGALAGSALCWYDPVYDYGEFEPVGTAPGHRGAGVGTALLRFGLNRLSEAGASHAVVGARADPDYAVPRRLYRAAGFSELAPQVVVRSPR